MSKTTTTTIEKEKYILFKCPKCDKSFKNSANDWTLAWKCPDHNDAGNEIYKIGYDDDNLPPPAQTTTKVILPEKTKAVDMTTISQSAGPVQLTEQQRNHAKEMKKLTEPKHTDHTNVSKWIRIRDGDTRTLFFDPDRYIEVASEYPKGSGNITPKIQFTVKDENSEEKFLELSFRFANRVIKFICPDELPDGTQPDSNLLLEISRQGSGKDTTYFIRPKYA